MYSIETKIDGNEVEIFVDQWTEGDDYGRTWTQFRITKVRLPWLGGVEIKIGKDVPQECTQALVGAVDSYWEDEKMEAELRQKGVD